LRRVNLFKCGARKALEGRKSLSERRNGSECGNPSAQWIELVAFVIGFNQVPSARAVKFAIESKDGFLRCGAVSRVEAEVRDHVVDVSIAVEIASCDPVPPAEFASQPSFRGAIFEVALIVEVELNRPPFERYKKVQPTVPVDVRPEGARDQTCL